MWVVQKSYTWIFFALNIVNYVTPNHYHLISNVDSGRIWRMNERRNVFTWIYCGGDVGGRSPQKWNRPSRKIQMKRFIKQTQKFLSSIFPAPRPLVTAKICPWLRCTICMIDAEQNIPPGKINFGQRKLLCLWRKMKVARLRKYWKNWNFMLMSKSPVP